MPNETVGINALIRKTRTNAVGVSAYLAPATFIRTRTVGVSGVLRRTISLTFGISAELTAFVPLSRTVGIDAYLLANAHQRNFGISAYLVFMPDTVTEPFRLFRARKSRR